MARPKSMILALGGSLISIIVFSKLRKEEKAKSRTLGTVGGDEGGRRRGRRRGWGIHIIYLLAVFYVKTFISIPASLYISPYFIPYKHPRSNKRIYNHKPIYLRSR